MFGFIQRNTYGSTNNSLLGTDLISKNPVIWTQDFTIQYFKNNYILIFIKLKYSFLLK